MKLNKIKVYGKLRQDLGSSYFEAAVNSPAEAFRFLIANFPDLEKYMNYQYYKVKMNGNDLTEEELNLRSEGVIQIIPIATGSIPFVAGVGALFAGSAVSGVATGFLGAKLVGSLTVGAAIGGTLTSIGTSMIIGGVTKMLTPTPNITQPTFTSSPGMNRNDATLEDSNYNFSGITNVSRAGVTLPVVYGEIFVGSILVSNGVDTAQLTNVRAITSN